VDVCALTADDASPPWWYDTGALSVVLSAARAWPEEPAAAAGVAPAAALAPASAPASLLAPSPWAQSLARLSSASGAAVSPPSWMQSTPVRPGDIVRLARNYEAFSDAVRSHATRMEWWHARACSHA
jgi:hypothetical protein